MVTPEYGSQTIEGSIKNIGTEYADFPSVTAILYDNNGKIIGVPTGYISGMGMYSGQSESFEIYLFDFQRVPDTTIAKYNLEIGYMDYQMNC